MSASEAGLSPQRTELAWRRTALAPLALGALIARLAPNASGILLALAAVGAALAVLIARHLQTVQGLLGTGVAAALLAATICVLAAACLLTMPG